MTRAVGGPKIHSKWSASAGVLSFYRDNASTQLAFGENDTGLDVKLYGDTAGVYVLWDESADTLEGASGATLNWDGPVELAGTVSCAAAAAFTSSVSFAGPALFTGSIITFGDAATDVVKAVGTASFAAAVAFTSSVSFAGPAAFTGSTITLGDAAGDIVGVVGTASFAAPTDFTSSVSFAGTLTITGSKTTIGDAAADTIGFFGASPTIQLANVDSATCAASPSTAVAAVVAGLINLGLMAASA